MTPLTINYYKVHRKGYQTYQKCMLKTDLMK